MSKPILMSIFSSLLFIISSAQLINVKGTIIDSATNLPVEGATVIWFPAKITSVSDERGKFAFVNISQPGSVIVNSVGYAGKRISQEELAKHHNIITITPQAVELEA